jgi:hypothetical protein
MAKLRQWFKRQYQELDLLPEYFGVVASRWQALLWGGSVLAIGWGLWFVVSEWRPWVNWTAVLVALFFAGYYAWETDHRRLTPGIYIEPRPNLQQTPVTHTSYDHIAVLVTHRTFVQIIPRCIANAPAYECRGYLKEFRRWCPVTKTWETMDMRSLQLQWDNSDDDEITLHPGVEKPLNIVFIRHDNPQVFPCVFADIPIPRIVDTFRRRPGAVEAYEFDVYVTSSDRVNGELVSTLPASATVRVQVTNDPKNPVVEVIPDSSVLTSWTPGE